MHLISESKEDYDFRSRLLNRTHKSKSFLPILYDGFIMRSCSKRANKDLHLNFIQNKMTLGSNNMNMALEYSFQLGNGGSKYVKQH